MSLWYDLAPRGASQQALEGERRPTTELRPTSVSYQSLGSTHRKRRKPGATTEILDARKRAWKIPIIWRETQLKWRKQIRGKRKVQLRTPKSYSTLRGGSYASSISYSDIFGPQYLRLERYLKIGLLQIELGGVIQEKGEALTQYEWWCPYKEGKSGDRCIQVETKAEID